MNIDYMKVSLKEAIKAYKIGEIPVGAVIIKDNKIISKAHNLKEKNNQTIDHAEIIAIKRASKKLNSWRLNDCVMYVNLKPCPMCASAIKQSRIKKIYYSTEINNKSINNLVDEILSNNDNNGVVDIEKIDCEESMLLIKNFFKKCRKNQK